MAKSMSLLLNYLNELQYHYHSYQEIINNNHTYVNKDINIIYLLLHIRNILVLIIIAI